MTRKTLFILGAFIALGAFAVQFNQIKTLQREVSIMRIELLAQKELKQSAEIAAPETSSAEAATLQTRLEHLERSVANLARATRFAAPAAGENGIAQPSDQEIARLEQRLNDSTASEGDRLKALRVLRRNNKLGDDAVAQTLSLLQTSTNANIRRDFLQQLDGSTNAALKQPLLAMLDNDMNQNAVREQVVNMLRGFTDDPTVEAKLWDVALNDPNTRVRDQAREALTHAAATPERVEQLLTKASNAEASLDERLISFRALRLAKSQTPELVSELAALAQNTSDPIARAKLFKSFNGLTDPALMLPLVNGLQDADPVVRQNAANALSEFPDSRVQQWLTHLIQNDSDPAVKREAHAALERTQRLTRQTPR